MRAMPVVVLDYLPGWAGSLLLVWAVNRVLRE